MAVTADRVIVIGRGRLIADTTVAELTRRAAGGLVRVVSPDATRLRALLLGPDVTITSMERDVLEVSGLTSRQVGTAAADAGLTLYELTPRQASLEEAFMDLTRDAVEFETPRPVTRTGEGR